MASVLNVTGSPLITQATPSVARSQAATPAASALPAQPTLTQLLEEPTYELTQQALAGNQQAIQLLAQQKAASALFSPTGAGGPKYGSIDILA